jgi:hypothetical protein
MGAAGGHGGPITWVGREIRVVWLASQWPPTCAAPIIIGAPDISHPIAHANVSMPGWVFCRSARSSFTTVAKSLRGGYRMSRLARRRRAMIHRRSPLPMEVQSMFFIRR